MYFLGIISWKSASVSMRGGCFSDRGGGASFLSGRGGPHEGALVLMVGGGDRKKL